MTAPVIINATARHTATVIFMHGLGDTGHGWAAAFEAIKVPHIKYIFPTAPVSPVTVNDGFRMPSWFDIKSLEAEAYEDEAGIIRAAKNVHSWIDDETKANNGIKHDRVLIGGFSQGGSLAIYSCLTYPQRLAGLLVLSSRKPLATKLPVQQCNTTIPMLQCQGDQDPMVTPRIARMTAEMLSDVNPKHHVFKMYAGLPHSSNEEEMNDVSAFIRKILPAV